MPTEYIGFTVPSELMAFRQTFWVENIRACLADPIHLERYLDFYVQNTIDAIQLNPRLAINALRGDKIEPRSLIDQIKNEPGFEQSPESHPVKLIVNALEILISDADVSVKRNVLAKIYQKIAPQVLADLDKDVLADYAGLASYSHMPALIAMQESLDNPQYIFDNRLIFARHLINHLFGVSLQVFDTEEDRQKILSDFAAGKFEDVKVALSKVNKKAVSLRPGLANLLAELLDAKDAAKLGDEIKKKLTDLQKPVFYQAGKDILRSGLFITDKVTGENKRLRFLAGNKPREVEKISNTEVLEIIYLDVPESAYDQVALAIADHLRTEYQYSNQFIAYLFSSCHQMAYINMPIGIQRHFMDVQGSFLYEAMKFSHEVILGAAKQPERVVHRLGYVKKHPEFNERPPFAEIQVVQHLAPHHFARNKALTEYLPGTFTEENITVNYRALDYAAGLDLPETALLQYATKMMRITKQNIGQQVAELRKNLQGIGLEYFAGRDQFGIEIVGGEPANLIKLLEQFKNFDRSSLEQFVRENDALIDELQGQLGNDLNNLVAQYYDPVKYTDIAAMRRAHPGKEDAELRIILQQHKQRSFAEIFKLAFHLGGHVSDAGMSGITRANAEHHFIQDVLEKIDNPVLLRYLNTLLDQRANLAAVVEGVEALSKLEQNQESFDLHAIKHLSPLFTAMRDFEKVSANILNKRRVFFENINRSYNPLRYFKKHPIRAGLFFIGGVLLITAGVAAWPFATALLAGAGLAGAGVAIVTLITGMSIPVLAGIGVGVFFGGILTSLLASAFGMSTVKQPVPDFVPPVEPSVVVPQHEAPVVQTNIPARMQQTVQEKQLAEIIAFIKNHATDDLEMISVHRLFNISYEGLIQELKATLLSLKPSETSRSYTKLVDAFEDLLKGNALDPDKEIFINNLESIIRRFDDLAQFELDLKKIKELLELYKSQSPLPSPRRSGSPPLPDLALGTPARTPYIKRIEVKPEEGQVGNNLVPPGGIPQDPNSLKAK